MTPHLLFMAGAHHHSCCSVGDRRGSVYVNLEKRADAKQGQASFASLPPQLRASYCPSDRGVHCQGSGREQSAGHYHQGDQPPLTLRRMPCTPQAYSLSLFALKLAAPAFLHRPPHLSSSSIFMQVLHHEGSARHREIREEKPHREDSAAVHSGAAASSTKPAASASGKSKEKAAKSAP